jgi:hypothetical protein
MVRLYIPPLPQPTASTLVVVDFFITAWCRTEPAVDQMQQAVLWMVISAI